VPIALAGVTAGLCLVGAFTAYGLLKPRLNAPQFAEIEKAGLDWRYPKGLTSSRTPSGLRLFSKGDGEQKVLFFGDSNMQQYWPRIEALLEEPGARKGVVFATTGGCPPIRRVREAKHPNCIDFAEKVMDWAGDPGVTTVVFGAAWYKYFSDAAYYVEGEGGGPLIAGTAAWMLAFDELSAMVRKLRDGGKTVWIILNIPRSTELHPGAAIRRTLLGEADVVPRFVNRARFETTWSKVKTKLVDIAAANGARVLDPADWLCNADRCPALTPEGKPMYKDASHLRASYVREHVTFVDRVLDDEPAVVTGQREPVRAGTPPADPLSTGALR
jgi:hypothetical protein